jgi:hypothetical protein
MNWNQIIYVTEENIHSGKPKSEEHCPVALAIRGRFPTYATEVRVNQDEIMIFTEDEIITFPIPEIVEEFINEFDDLVRVEPFHFELKHPTIESRIHDYDDLISLFESR